MAAPDAGVLGELANTFASARGWVSNFLALVSLEARRAGLTLVWMVTAGLAAAVFLVGAWVAVLAALALWAVSLGFPPVATALAIAAANLLAGLGLIRMCIAASRDLLFSATRRQLAPKAEVNVAPVVPVTP